MMKTRTRAALAFSVLLVSGSAQAADWVSIAKSADGKQEFFVDRSSIRAAGDIRRAWVKAIFVPRTMKSAVQPKKWWDYDLSRDAFNCAEETYRKEALTVYYDDGTVIADPAESFPTPWTPVPPETILEAEMKFICSWILK